MTSQCEWQPIETLLQKDGLVLLLFYGGIIRIGRKSEGLFVCSLNIANTDVHVTCMGNDLPTGWKQLPDIPVDELSLKEKRFLKDREVRSLSPDKLRETVTN